MRFRSGETRTRTGDTTIFSRVLYQLSYLAERRQGSAGGSRVAGAATVPIMAETTFVLRVWRKGRRGEELLERLGAELGRHDLVADDSGVVRLRMEGRGGRSWDALRDALDRAGPDWREWIHLEARPPR